MAEASSGLTGFPAQFKLHDVLGQGDAARCGCGRASCQQVGKHPAVNFTDIEPGSWYQGPFIGICTGRDFGIVVIDIDDKGGKDGFASLEALEAHLGDLPDTYTVQTGSGSGVHYYFKHPHDGPEIRNSQGKLGVGIDVRGYNGFVVAEGSTHRSGKKYTAVNGTTLLDLADLPEAWIAELRKAAPETAPDAACYNAIDVRTPEGERILDYAIRRVSTYPKAVSGHNGSGTTIGLANLLKVGLLLPIDLVMGLMGDYNESLDDKWTEQELVHKVNSATAWGTAGWGHAFLEANSTGSFQEHMDKVKQTHKNKDFVKEVVLRPMSPTHVYSVKIGDISSLDEAKKDRAEFPLIQKVLFSHKAWSGVLRYDEFSNKVFAFNPPIALDAENGDDTNEDASRIAVWFDVVMGLNADVTLILRAMRVVALQNKFNPVVDYLMNLPLPSGARLLDNLAETLFGDTSAIAQVLLRKTLVAAIRRVIEPGCQVDTLLILQGAQGLKKSSFCRTLFQRSPLPGSHWYVGSPQDDLLNKDTFLNMQGAWCVEFQEFDTIVRKRDSGGVKAFMATPSDKFREPYARASKNVPRRCIFVATSNSDELLVDPTGARRFWPTYVLKEIDIPWLEAHTDQIWAEALEIALRPHTQAPSDVPNWHWLTKAEEALLGDAQEHLEEDLIGLDEVEAYCKGKPVVQLRDLCSKIVVGEEDTSARRAGLSIKQAKTCLARLGCVKSARVLRENFGKWPAHTKVMGYWTPADIAKAPEGKKYTPPSGPALFRQPN